MGEAGTWHGGIGLSPGDFVLDGDPVFPPQQRGQSPLPIFGQFLLCPNGWMHQDAIGMEVGLSPGEFVLDGDPAPSPKFHMMEVIR